MKVVDVGNNNILQLDDYHCIITGYEQVDEEYLLKMNVTRNIDDLDDPGEDITFTSSIKPRTIDIKDYQLLQLDSGETVNIYKTIEGKYLIGEELNRISNMYIEHQYEVINTYSKLVECIKSRYNRKAVKSLEIS